MTNRAMTVEELIEQLQKMPQQAAVCAENGCGDGKAQIECAGMEDGNAVLRYYAEGLEYRSN